MVRSSARSHIYRRDQGWHRPVYLLGAVLHVQLSHIHAVSIPVVNCTLSYQISHYGCSRKRGRHDGVYYLCPRLLHIPLLSLVCCTHRWLAYVAIYIFGRALYSFVVTIAIFLLNLIACVHCSCIEAIVFQLHGSRVNVTMITVGMQIFTCRPSDYLAFHLPNHNVQMRALLTQC